MQRFDCLAKETSILGPHFLEASAGTGKTFAIEHVVARLLLSGKFSLEQILVVTFTKAAARELKLRIRSNLDRLVTNFPEGPAYLEGVDIRLLTDALATFDRCQIFTIHSFCSRMLTEFGLEANIVLQTGQTGSRKREAGIRDFFEAGLSPDLICPEQLDILLRWAGGVAELVHELKIADCAIGATPFALLLQEFYCQHETLDPDKLQQDWIALQGNYKKVKGDLEGQITALATRNFPKLIEEKGSIFAFIAPENRKVRAKDPTFLHYPNFFEEGRKKLLPLIQKAADPKEILQVLVGAWKPIDRKILFEEGTLSNDELLYAMQQAVDKESFCQKVRQKYGAILIDEFQDTDPVQWDIFDRLFLCRQEEKTIYLIGDPKQSIYRFRKADLYTYLKAKRTMAPEQHFHLDTNFRSSKELIGALNFLFDRSWLHLPKEKTSIPYIPVRAGLDLITPFQDDKGAIHCVQLPKQEIYAYIANEIIRMKDCGVAEKDWAILVKDRYEGVAMQKMLTKMGIASSCKGRELLCETASFGAIRDLFEALAEPTHLSLAKRVLAGPLGQYSGEEIQSVDHSPFKVYRALLEEQGLSRFFQTFFQHWPLCDSQFQADCFQVLEHLFEWERKDGFSFDGVFRFFEAFVAKDSEEAVFQRKEEGEDDVQIMTMHMSKGLEFPVVFALGLASRTPPGDEEVQAEKLRQLYVATTRAKHRLYIPILEESKQATEGTHAPMELFCQTLGNWKEELDKIGSQASLSFEKVVDPIVLEAPLPAATCEIARSAILPLPPFEPSYLLSFTALSRGVESEPLDPLPEGDLPRGAETGVVIHRIFERIFSEPQGWKHRSYVSHIVREEIGKSPFAQWEHTVEGLVQATLDLQLPHGFCLRDLDRHVRAEVEFLFEAPPHYLKGFIDLIFQREGQIYFVDWKTNWLKNYTVDALQETIRLHKYDLQASIYAEALKKSTDCLQVHAIYVFIRGPGTVCFQPGNYSI